MEAGILSYTNYILKCQTGHNRKQIKYKHEENPHSYCRLGWKCGLKTKKSLCIAHHRPVSQRNLYMFLYIA